MGMFDWVDYECRCDICKAKVTGFQSKDGNCTLDHVSPFTVNEFYSSCSKCGSWITIGKFAKVS